MMTWFRTAVAVSALSVLPLAAAAQVGPPAAPPAATTTLTGGDPVTVAPVSAYQTMTDVNPQLSEAPRTRGRFESDKAFDGFINPISNPVFAKDPRSSTWARILFVNNNFPGSHPFGGGDAQAYAMQLNVALTDRLALIADKDGYADINTTRGGHTGGWLNLAAGLKYTFVRDVENQFLMAAGLMYEIPTGEAAAFQGHGSGNFTPFVTWGKQVGCDWHLMGTHGYSFGATRADASAFFYHSLHVDRSINGWFYPLVEFNWFQYTDGGNRLPRVIGEGDGLLNLGTQGMQGRQLFTTAVGAKAKLSANVWAGAAYEIALSGYKGLLNNRITADVVLRY